MASYDEEVDALVGRVHTIDACFGTRRLRAGARGDKELELAQVVSFFVTWPPVPVLRPPGPFRPRGDDEEADAEDLAQWKRAHHLADLEEWDEVTKERARIVAVAKDQDWGTCAATTWSDLPARWVPVAELKSFLLGTVRATRDLNEIKEFPFDELAKCVGRHWNEHVNAAKQLMMRQYEVRKRKFDALLVDQDNIEEERPWKRARKDV